MTGYYLSLAWRSLTKSPYHAALLIMTFAIGIAASMATNTLRYALARNPMPEKSHRLLSVQNPDMEGHTGNLLSYANVRQLSKVGKQYGEFIYSGLGFGIKVVRPDNPSRHSEPYMRYTTLSFFKAFDVKLEKGRLWTRQEADDNAPVVVISKTQADSLFPGGSAVGKMLRIGHFLYTIIGITAPWDIKPRFYNLEHPAGPFGGNSTSMFLPVSDISMAPDGMKYQIGCPGTLDGFPKPSSIIPRGCQWFRVWYFAHSNHDADILRKLIEARIPDIFLDDAAKDIQVLNVGQIIAKADLVPGSVHLYALLGIAFLALCTINASGMQLSRVLKDRQQIGIRRALGASRAQIVTQYLLDACLTGGIAGLMGIGFTFAALLGIRHLLSANYANMAHMDPPMFMAMLVLVLVCSLLTGVIPACLASMEEPSLTIKSAQ